MGGRGKLRHHHARVCNLQQPECAGGIPDSGRLSGGRDDLEDEKLVRQIILYRLLRCDLSGSCGNGLPWGNAWADVLGRTFRAAFRKAADSPWGGTAFADAVYSAGKPVGENCKLRYDERLLLAVSCVDLYGGVGYHPSLLGDGHRDRCI